MHGNGGFAGRPPDSSTRAPFRDSALQHGFAAAYTDTGHDRRAEPLATFAHNNLQKEIDKVSVNGRCTWRGHRVDSDENSETWVITSIHPVEVKK